MKKELQQEEKNDLYQPGSFIGSTPPPAPVTIVREINFKPLIEMFKGAGRFWRLAIPFSMITIGIDMIFFLLCLAIQFDEVNRYNQANPDALHPKPSLWPLDHPIMMIFIIAVNIIVVGGSLAAYWNKRR